MKRRIKRIFFNNPVNGPLMGLLKQIYIPPDPIRRYLKFNGKFVVKTQDGKQIHFTNNCFGLENQIFWLGLDNNKWEMFTRKIWAHLCKKSGTIFDIGANIGVFSLLAKTYSPKSLVYSFEPQPNIYTVLERNIALNQFDIRCRNLALSDSVGEMPFYNYGTEAFEGNTTAGSLNKDFMPADQQSIMVNVDRIDCIMEKDNINKIDLIKIDVETHEPNVLSGYQNLLKHKPVILLEIQDPEIGKKIEELVPAKEYLYYHINESTGLRAVSNLGTKTQDKNYLLCPNSEVDKLQELF